MNATSSARRQPIPLPANIASAQPGGGWAFALELAWGRLRRWWLRRMHPGYVARMMAVRRGECPSCVHDVIDDRDLKFFGNVCGHHFAPADIPRRWREALPLAPHGRCEVLLYGGLASLGAVVATCFGVYSIAVILALLTLFVVAFFRNPARRIPHEAGLIVSPADGVVTDVEELSEVPFWDGPAVKIGIYLSVFNVHVNRVPDTARVIEVRYNPGQFLNTAWPAAARVNEHCWVVFEREDAPHHLVAVKQIAGTFARRIVCEARPGEVIQRGKRYGMIKFGSRTELYLAKCPGLCVAVVAGNRVKGGSSVVATYGPDGRNE